MRHFPCHAFTWGPPVRTLMRHDYILPQFSPLVNIALPHALLRWPPHRGKHGQKSAREKGLDFGRRFGYVGLCGNQFIKLSSSWVIRCGKGFYVTKCNPAHAPPGPPQEAGPSRVRTLTFPISPHSYISLCNLLDERPVHMESNGVRQTLPQISMLTPPSSMVQFI